jgi:hypothetical protein
MFNFAKIGGWSNNFVAASFTKGGLILGRDNVTGPAVVNAIGDTERSDTDGPVTGVRQKNRTRAAALKGPPAACHWLAM